MYRIQVNCYSMRILRLLLTSLVIFQCLFLFSQETPIYLTNPSFEDLPRHSTAPRGWIDCGFNGESAVDVHPSGTFAVVKQPQDGNTYLGMVVRDNDTWEMVSQPLSTPMQAGKCYEFSIYLARSETYVSVSKLTEERANFTTPAKLRIYGGYSACERGMLLGETNLIIHPRWIQYSFKFEPDQNYNYITFEAFFKTPTLFPYNGNLLLDNASELTLIPCNEEEIVEEEPIEEPVEEPVTPPVTPPVVETTPVTNTPPPPVVTNTPKPPATTPAPQEVIESVDFDQLKRADIKEGTILRTNQIFFAADKSDINEKSFDILNQLYEFLQKNSDVRIEIGGHTNGLPPPFYCDQLSTARAKAVVEYLQRKGITRNRLEFKGYGKRELIASDATSEGRRKNQRVEVKILTLGDG